MTVSPRRALAPRRAGILAAAVLLSLSLPAAPASAAGSAAAKPTAKPAAKPTAKPAAKLTAKPTTKPVAKPSLKPVATATAVPTLATRLAAVQAAKSINYYPATAGWTKMWTTFDSVQIDADLAKAAALGATNVRALIFPETFGYPAPKAEYRDKLARFVDLAAARGMTVKFTLFDWWGGYADVAGSRAWATAILQPYATDPRVIAVELQNELDPANASAMAWAKAVLPAVRSAVPTIPLTVSTSGTAGIAGLAKIKAALSLDYFDFHFYGNSERSLATIRQAQAAVAPGPMVIGETGLNTLQNTEGEQAAFLARVFQAAAAAGVRSVAPWTLTDFAAGAIPASNVAKLPAQYSYGLFRTDGTAKPAAAVVKASFTGTALPAGLMDNGFEAAAGQTPWRAYLTELGLAVKTQTAARTGTWSIRFTNTGKQASGSPAYRVAPITPVQAGQKWHAEVWARGAAATGTTQIALSWFAVDDTWLGGASSAALRSGTTNWTKLSVDEVAPAGAASLQIHLKSGANTGSVWFDDVATSPAL
ncbi:MAG TPA: glycosyl hydrolase [Actinoplanes sp.]